MLLSRKIQRITWQNKLIMSKIRIVLGLHISALISTNIFILRAETSEK